MKQNVFQIIFLNDISRLRLIMVVSQYDWWIVMIGLISKTSYHHLPWYSKWLVMNNIKIDLKKTLLSYKWNTDNINIIIMIYWPIMLLFHYQTGVGENDSSDGELLILSLKSIKLFKVYILSSWIILSLKIFKIKHNSLIFKNIYI